MATVKQLYDLLDRKAPFRTQMDFDNAGFLVGRGDRTVTRVLVALDITPEVIAEAAEKGCQLILAHHPVIWGKLGQVTDESATGRKVLALIEKGIAAICAHTNLDAAEGGVNTALAQRLGLENPVPLETDGVDEAGRPYGIGRVGSLPGGPLSLADFARKAKENLGLAGIRAKAHAALYNGSTLLADYRGEVQFTDYGLSGICIMDLTRHLTPAVKSPAVELDLFPDIAEDALSALFAARVPLLPGDTAADFWLGLLNAKLGRALWQAAGLPDADVHRLSAAQWQKLAHTAKHWRFDGLTPCGWKQAQVTGGGLALTELEPDFQFKGCPGLYFVGETLDCVGRCGGFNLHWAFGSGLAAGRSAAKPRRAVPSQKPPRKKKH